MATADAGLEGVEFGVPAEVLPPGVVEFVLGEPDARVYQFIFKAVLEPVSIRPS